MSTAEKLVTILLAIVSFFLIRLVNQLDKLDTKLGSLEKSILLYDQAVKFLEKELLELKEDYKKLLSEHASLKKVTEAFDDWLNEKGKTEARKMKKEKENENRK